MKPIRISVVSYLNSLPFIHGLRNWQGSTPIELELDIPSVCAEKLATGKADIGLIPVAALPHLPHFHIISNYCIGADGAVDSVLLLSEVPLEKIETILLDYQSRTSVMLTKILAERYWKINVEWKATTPDYENSIKGTIGGVIIGDRALKLRNRFPYQYDLATEWKKMTGLPFVFATWTATTELPEDFIQEFNKALEKGFQEIDLVIEKANTGDIDRHSIREYLTKSIDYKLDERKKKAMELFLSYIK